MEIRPLLSALWRSRTGPLMVAAQIAITVMILVNVAYVVAVRIEISNRPTGIDIDNIFWILSEGYVSDYSHANTTRADLHYLNSIPGVAAASISSNLPQTFSGIRLEISSEPAGKGNKTVSIIYQASERMVETLGLNLQQGRTPRAEVMQPIAADMNASLSSLPPEVVITRALATRLFGKENALGRSIYFGLINRSSTVAGIVERMQAAPYYAPGVDFVESVVLIPAIPPGPTALDLV